MIGFAPALLFLLWTPEAPPLLQNPIEATPDPQYLDCVALIGENIEIGRIAATQWVTEGGGPEAQHCLAVADLAAGFPKLAAIRLEELAERSDSGDALIRARILSQAALAWLEADQPDLAKTAVDHAFTLAPDAGELYLTAAQTYAANEMQQATIDAVVSAEELGFVSADGFVLRGRARYALTDYRTAAEDVVAALRLDPFNLDALVLRGELRQVGIEIGASYTRADRSE